MDKEPLQDQSKESSNQPQAPKKEEVKTPPIKQLTSREKKKIAKSLNELWPWARPWFKIPNVPNGQSIVFDKILSNVQHDNEQDEMLYQRTMQFDAVLSEPFDYEIDWRPVYERVDEELEIITCVEFPIIEYDRTGKHGLEWATFVKQLNDMPNSDVKIIRCNDMGYGVIAFQFVLFNPKLLQSLDMRLAELLRKEQTSFIDLLATP